MCGIVGYTGRRPAGPILLDGLRRLEYRGYDSAGIALFDADERFYVAHATGKLDALVQRVEGVLPPATSGIGHTRWATHGEPSDRNAHPQLDPDGVIAVIHNGIIENFEELRARYARGPFRSETDTEVLAHMLAGEVERGEDLLDALRHVVALARGAYSLVAVAVHEPGRMVAARVGNAGGIVIGTGEGEHLLASDLGALLPHTRRVTFLEPGEFVDMRAESVRYVDIEGVEITKAIEVLPYDPVSAVKGPYKHFMLKEIHEQPDAVLNAMRGRYLTGPLRVDYSGEVPFDAAWAKALTRVVLVAIGTSMHSAMVGRHYF
jgi:glucosamine--fructose-6-phosphate aminotransferase (isomerizing)